MLVTKGEYFDDNYQLKKELPKFYWMKINGRKLMDDVYSEVLDLFCSESFLRYLQDNAQCKYLEIDPERDKETDDFIMSLINRDKGLN